MLPLKVHFFLLFAVCLYELVVTQATNAGLNLIRYSFTDVGNVSKHCLVFLSEREFSLTSKSFCLKDREEKGKDLNDF